AQSYSSSSSCCSSSFISQFLAKSSHHIHSSNNRFRSQSKQCSRKGCQTPAVYHSYRGGFTECRCDIVVPARCHQCRLFSACGANVPACQPWCQHTLPAGDRNF
ncbi:unnamed protein product, partial [Ectocarpus sp. 12 AP-2014]